QLLLNFNIHFKYIYTMVRCIQNAFSRRVFQTKSKYIDQQTQRSLTLVTPPGITSFTQLSCVFVVFLLNALQTYLERFLTLTSIACSIFVIFCLAYTLNPLMTHLIPNHIRLTQRTRWN